MDHDPTYPEFYRDELHAIRTMVERGRGTRQELALALRPQLKGRAEGWLNECLAPGKPSSLSGTEIHMLERLTGRRDWTYWHCDGSGLERPRPLVTEARIQAAHERMVAAVEANSAVLSRLLQLRQDEADRAAARLGGSSRTVRGRHTVAHLSIASSRD